MFPPNPPSVSMFDFLLWVTPFVALDPIQGPVTDLVLGFRDPFSTHLAERTPVKVLG